MEAKAQIKAGDNVKAFGYEWDILDPEYQGKDGKGILCLSKSAVKNMAFSKTNKNDYGQSDVKEYLENEFNPRLIAYGAKFKTVELDLMADDGTGDGKEPLIVKGAFLLTDALYRKYHRFISKGKKRWWTATAFSFDPDISPLMRFVCMDGSFGDSSVFYDYYEVIPACIFSFLPEPKAKDAAEKIEELEKRVAELEKRIKEVEVPQFPDWIDTDGNTVG